MLPEGLPDVGSVIGFDHGRDLADEMASEFFFGEGLIVFPCKSITDFRWDEFQFSLSRARATFIASDRPEPAAKAFGAFVLEGRQLLKQGYENVLDDVRSVFVLEALSSDPGVNSDGVEADKSIPGVRFVDLTQAMKQR